MTDHFTRRWGSASASDVRFALTAIFGPVPVITLMETLSTDRPISAPSRTSTDRGMRSAASSFLSGEDRLGALRPGEDKPRPGEDLYWCPRFG